MLALVEFWANRRSKDPSTKVGAAIVSGDERRRVLSLGYNGFPMGFPDDEIFYSDRLFKYDFVCHAERNALDLAECSVVGATLYCVPLPVCRECAKTIAQRGIDRVIIGTRGYVTRQPWLGQWADSLNIFKNRKGSPVRSFVINMDEAPF